jgi:hypothetical protein
MLFNIHSLILYLGIAIELGQFISQFSFMLPLAFSRLFFPLIKRYACENFVLVPSTTNQKQWIGQKANIYFGEDENFIPHYPLSKNSNKNICSLEREAKLVFYFEKLDQNLTFYDFLL